MIAIGTKVEWFQECDQGYGRVLRRAGTVVAADGQTAVVAYRERTGVSFCPPLCFQRALPVRKLYPAGLPLEPADVAAELLVGHDEGLPPVN